MHFDNLLQKKRLYSAAMLVKREASLKNVHFEQKRIKKALTQKLLLFEMMQGFFLCFLLRKDIHSNT